ncbi:hypothetical protein [Streptomyces sp. NPDC050534]|uniref:hypothetical protein n=1 Tax=Streptomyces sp. NPDC050534 TaxID=3365625 RepID=UPI0037BB9580
MKVLVASVSWWEATSEAIVSFEGCPLLAGLGHHMAIEPAPHVLRGNAVARAAVTTLFKASSATGAVVDVDGAVVAGRDQRADA